MSSDEDETNINIEDYTIDELKDLFKIENLNREEIQEKLSLFRYGPQNKSEDIQEFIDRAEEKLLDEVRKEQSIINDRSTYKFNEHEVTADNSLQRYKFAHNVKYARDGANLNSLFTNTYTKLINLDSKYREYSFPIYIFDKNTICNLYEEKLPQEINYSDMKYYSSSYNAKLSESLKNAVALHIDSFSIPHSWYNISKKYGTNYFYYKVISHDFIGDYEKSACKKKGNEKCQEEYRGTCLNNDSSIKEDCIKAQITLEEKFNLTEQKYKIYIPEGNYDSQDLEPIYFPKSWFRNNKKGQFITTLCRFNILHEFLFEYYKSNNIVDIPDWYNLSDRVYSNKKDLTSIKQISDEMHPMQIIYDSYIHKITKYLSNVKIPKIINIINKTIFNNAIDNIKNRYHFCPFLFYNPISNKVGLYQYCITMIPLKNTFILSYEHVDKLFNFAQLIIAANQSIQIAWYDNEDNDYEHASSNHNLGSKLGFVTTKSIIHLVDSITPDKNQFNQDYINIHIENMLNYDPESISSIFYNYFVKGIPAKKIPDPILYKNIIIIGFNSNNVQITSTDMLKINKLNPLVIQKKDVLDKEFNNIIDDLINHLLNPIRYPNKKNIKGSDITAYKSLWNKTLNDSNAYYQMAQGPLNINLTNYLYISINDFNDNKISNNFIYNIGNENTVNNDFKTNQKRLYSVHYDIYQQLCKKFELVKFIAKESQNYWNIVNVISYEEEGDLEKEVDKIRNIKFDDIKHITNAELNRILSFEKEKTIKVFKSSAPNKENCFILPIHTKFNEIISSSTINFNDQLFTYFGPVNINQIAISILTENNYILDLNKKDWQLGLKATILYDN